MHAFCSLPEAVHGRSRYARRLRADGRCVDLPVKRLQPFQRAGASVATRPTLRRRRPSSAIRSSRTACAVLLCLALLARAGTAQDSAADVPPEEVTAPSEAIEAVPDEVEERPPTYSFLRADEDWSAFVGGDRLDSIHRIELNRSGSSWIGFGGRAEARGEYWRNFNFGAPGGVDTEDAFLLVRLLLHADLHLGERFRLFIEGKTAHVDSRDLAGGERTIDEDVLDLQELFFDVDLPTGEDESVRLRPGRQMLLYGAQRLISPLPWGNTLRTWDGVTARWRGSGWTVDALATSFVPVDTTAFNTPDEDQLLYGVYATQKRTSGRVTDLYVLGSTRGDVNVNGTLGDSERWTLGARHQAAPADRVDLEVEAAYQFGEVGSGSVSAGFATLELGWRPPGLPWNTRLFTVLDYASGDREAGGDVETFDQLYPLGHAYLGYADVIGRQNVEAVALGLTCNPREELTLRLAGHSFWLAELTDAIYTAGGAVLRPPGSFESSHIAHEIDLSAVRSFGRHVLVSAGYSHVFAGQAIEDSGAAEDIDFAYLRLIFTF